MRYIVGHQQKVTRNLLVEFIFKLPKYHITEELTAQVCTGENILIFTDLRIS